MAILDLETEPIVEVDKDIQIDVEYLQMLAGLEHQDIQMDRVLTDLDQELLVAATLDILDLEQDQEAALTTVAEVEVEADLTLLHDLLQEVDHILLLGLLLQEVEVLVTQEEVLQEVAELQDQEEAEEEDSISLRLVED